MRIEALAGSILITGATGFVGRHVLLALLDRGVRAKVIAREGKETMLAGVPGVDSIIPSRSIFAESDDWWLDVLEGVDTVVHLAWYVEAGKYLMAPENLECLTGTLRLAKCAAAAGVRRFVGVGTCFEYDLSAGRLSVETPLKPTTPYAGAKAATYMALSQWLPPNQVEFAWCRLFYLYGEGEDEKRFVPYLRKSLEAGQRADLTTGSQVRDFLDVREAGRMIAETVVGDVQGPVNICSGVPVTIREFAERIADEYGRRDLLNFGGRPENLVDPPYVVGVR